MKSAITSAMMSFRARDVMNADVLAVKADATSREAAAFLTENQITGAPVIDRGGYLVGVVSLTDLAENEAERPDIVDEQWRPELDVRGWEERVDPADLRPLHIETADVLVRDIMTPTVYTVPDDTPVPMVARTMIAARIHRLFVTREEHVVGIVTPLDLLKLMAGDAPSAATRATSRVPMSQASGAGAASHRSHASRE